MIYRALYILVILLSGCTTFNANEAGVRRACRSGLTEYDDGTTVFKCKQKEIYDRRDNNPKQTERANS